MEQATHSLADKAIDIKGKKYVLVSDRVLHFNQFYPQGSITTEILSGLDDDTVVVKATVSPYPGRTFIGHSQATWGDGYINKTAALENAETSAVGRALAFMGIGVIDSIASMDEINKASNSAPVVKQKTENMAWIDAFAEAKTLEEWNAHIVPLFKERTRDFVVAAAQEAKRRGYVVDKATATYLHSEQSAKREKEAAA